MFLFSIAALVFLLGVALFCVSVIAEHPANQLQARIASAIAVAVACLCAAYSLIGTANASD